MKRRSHYCGQVGKNDIDQTVRLCGWVSRARDHGGVIFIDLFDYTGLVQIVAHPEMNDFSLIERLTTHSVLCVEGLVQSRPEGTENKNLSSGSVEVAIQKVTWHNTAQALGYDVNDPKVTEAVRASNRVLDIRSDTMQKSLRFRAKMMAAMRSYLDHDQFLEVETPILTRPTPEGARDYIVPSRVHPGHAFALPQSPQQFKQMLMMAAIDRYYQFARCFRDEDLRADRQPEFTQLDIEMSFMSADEVCAWAEGLMKHVVQEMLDVSLPTFPVMSYDDALLYYGTDAPNLANPLKFIPLDSVLKGCDFQVFSQPANDEDGRVAAIKLAGGCEKLSRKDLDGYTKQVMALGAKGLAYLKINDLSDLRAGISSPILKFLDDDTLKNLVNELQVEVGDVVFFGAGENRLVNLTLHALAKQLATDFDLFEPGLHFIWIRDFPMFERVDGTLHAVHHPFTAPEEDYQDLTQAKAQAYDLVLNGYELGGGSIRIADTKLQQEVFSLLGIDEAHAQQEFGHLLHTLTQGTPIHGGLAFGIDRVCMVLQGLDSIREVIAFPKTQTASCALTKAPGLVDDIQWQELSLKFKKVKSGG